MNSVNTFVNELTFEIIFFRLLLAVVFGGIVGLERERRHRPAGFRTHILVCIGAAIVSMVQDQLRIDILSLADAKGSYTAFIKTDLGRLGAQVISGIGFLGAGCIIKEKGEIVLGMTTAAGIWATGCVGLGIGWGFYNIAISAIVVMFIVMVVLRRVEDRFISRTYQISFEIKLCQKEDFEKAMIECYDIFKQKSMAVTEVEKDLENQIIVFNVMMDSKKYISDLLISLSAKPEVKYVRDSKKWS